MGGEWAAGTPLLQESVPEHMRVRLAGWLHTATPTAGGLLAALIVPFLLYPVLGWRGVFMIGVVPALMTIYVRWRIPEPARWRKRQVQTVALRARSLWPATLMLSCAIFGLWSSSFWAPAFIVTKVVEEGGSAARGQHLASISGLISNGGTMVACLLAPWIVSATPAPTAGPTRCFSWEPSRRRF